MRALAVSITVLLLCLAAGFQNNAQPKDPPLDKTHWVKLTFGLDGKAEPWDGQATIEGGRILESAPWSFEDRDRYDSASHKWFCTTVVLEGRSASSYAEPQRGALLHVERGESPRLKVTTQQGGFEVDVAALKPGKPATFLDGRASAELLGTSIPLPERATGTVAETEDDFPTLTIDRNGHRWIAWIGYNDEEKHDHLRVLDLDEPQASVAEIQTAREQTDPQLVTDGDGRVWLFWCAPTRGNWDVWAARHTGKEWGPIERITTAPGTDFHLQATTGPNGKIWLTWQSFRDGNGDVYAKRYSGGRWSEDVPVAAGKSNQWEPSIDIDADGRAWVAYDSYENGNYDVFLKSVEFDGSGKPAVGEQIAVATSKDFEAHASVEATGEGIVWVAYDAAGPNWGKDYTRDATEFQGRYAEPLHASRRVELRAIVDGKLQQPAVALPQQLDKLHPEKVNHSEQKEIKRFYEMPKLTRDGDGRLWLLFRLNRQGYCGHPKQGANWEFFATTFANDKWLEPILLPLSRGRQNQHIAAAPLKDGRLQLAWSTGHHQVDLPQRVRTGKLPSLKGKSTQPPLGPATTEKPKTTPEPLVRSWKLHRQGTEYQVYFGDLHRHTDVSLCTPTVDGSVVDAYRYALDAARLDFLAVTDHTRDTDPFPWWRTQKANDLFYVPGTLAAIYAYERSNSMAGGGHRNVFFLDRDWPVMRADYNFPQDQRAEQRDLNVALYPKLRGKNALTAAHTPGYVKSAKSGTWTYHDPQVEPVAEIIQTYRRDYERPGAPAWRDARIRGNIAEEASLWYALARGHKLGFIASSDHHATHTSFACVWAKGPSREEIFEALRSRRTYAATDKIILEVRMGEAVMGEEIEAPETPELSIHVRGTDVIEDVQIVRNREVIARMQPNEAEFETRFADKDYPGGAAYYYVRVRQKDNNMAWGSPIWVR